MLQNSFGATMAAHDDGEPVQLYVYDLSRGLAKQFAPLVGLQVNAHSGSDLLSGTQSQRTAAAATHARPPTVRSADVVSSSCVSVYAFQNRLSRICTSLQNSAALLCLQHSWSSVIPLPSSNAWVSNRLCLDPAQLEGIWHTSIVVGGQEIYYGGGIQTAVPGTTPHGQPVQVGL